MKLFLTLVLTSFLATLVAGVSGTSTGGADLTPEQEFLQWEQGTWDATIRIYQPGQPPQEMEGVQKDVLGCCNGWLITNLEMADSQASPYEGHGVLGFDPVRKKMVGVWVDSKQNWLGIAEGSVNKDASELILKVESRNPLNGQPMPTRWVVRRVGKDERHLDIHYPRPDGGEFVAVSIHSVRRS